MKNNFDDLWKEYPLDSWIFEYLGYEVTQITALDSKLLKRKSLTVDDLFLVSAGSRFLFHKENQLKTDEPIPISHRMFVYKALTMGICSTATLPFGKLTS
jgi:hypothetical protein